jgi:hypothetical protein
MAADAAPHHAARLIVALAAACAPLVACRSESSSAFDSESLAALDLPVARQDLPKVGLGWRETLPFFITIEENGRLYRAWQNRTQQCMSLAGFDYHPYQFPDHPDGLDRVSPLDEGIAKSLGYHHPPMDLEDLNVNADDAFTLALQGTETQPGCDAISYQEVYGAIAQFTFDLDTAVSSFEGSISGYSSSEQGADRLRQWSSCMSDRGYQYNDPVDAGNRYAEEPTVTAAELDTRMADLECDIETGLTTDRSNFESKKVDEWLAANDAVVVDLQEQKHEFERQLVNIEAEGASVSP